MDSLDKFKFLLELDRRNAKVRIISTRGEEYICRLYCPAEGEEDFAYHIVTAEKKPRIFILECNFIEKIEEISDAEWESHIKETEQRNDI